MDFDFKQLKEEYALLTEELRIKYEQSHKDYSSIKCDKYIKKQILCKARKLYDYALLKKMIYENTPLDKILMFHKSTKERSVDFNYYNELSSVLSISNRVIDIGCGLNPVMVSKSFDNIKEYYCIDKDKKILEILSALSDRLSRNNLILIKNDFNNFPEEIKNEHFDFAFIQKLIPMLSEKHNRRILNNIANISSKYFLITGNKLSLSRNISIEEKEKKSLEMFIKKYGFTKIAFFNKETEFGWVVTKE